VISRRIPTAIHSLTSIFTVSCDAMQKLNELGYFSLDERADLPGKTFRQVMAGLIGKEDATNLKADLAAFLNLAINSGVMMALEWLGLLSDALVPDRATLLDVLADQMLAKMAYRERERDMVILVHEFVAAYPKTSFPSPSPYEGEGGRTPSRGPHEEEWRRGCITSTLIDYGEPGRDTAMARTVGLPAAISARLILEGEINLTGVHIPVLPEIYEPVLGELERLGIACVEKVEVLG